MITSKEWLVVDLVEAVEVEMAKAKEVAKVQMDKEMVKVQVDKEMVKDHKVEEAKVAEVAAIARLFKCSDLMKNAHITTNVRLSAVCNQEEKVEKEVAVEVKVEIS